MRFFYECLADLKYDVEVNGDHYGNFSPHVDPEADPNLNHLFEWSGLSPEKPGHWQELTRALSNLMGARKRPVKKTWTPERSMLLLDKAYRIRRRSPDFSLKEICAELAMKGMPFEKDGIKTTLPFRFQEAIRPIRQLVKIGKASKRQIEIVAAFENLRGRISKTGITPSAKKRTKSR
jgi:hypothetical protein